MKIRKAIRKIIRKGADKAPSTAPGAIPCPTGQGLSDAQLMRRVDPLRTLD